MENVFYVYEHYKPNCNEPFYVGKGHDDRAYWKYNRNPHWHNIVNKHGFEVRFVAENLSEQDAFWLENVCIVGWGRKDKDEGPLVNMSDGGEGSSGAIRSDEWKQAHSGENASGFGKTGNKNPMFGLKGKDHPAYGRCKEQHPMYGKSNPAQSLRMAGENNPMYGKRGKSAPMYGRNGNKNPMYGKPSPMKGKKLLPTKWITNGTDDKKLKVGESIEYGWRFGRTGGKRPANNR